MTLRSGSFSSLDQQSSLASSSHLSSSQEMNISAPVPSLGPTLGSIPPPPPNEYLNTTPTHNSNNQSPPLPPAPPTMEQQMRTSYQQQVPSSVATTAYSAMSSHPGYHQHQIHHPSVQTRPLPEDTYDVPVAAAYVSISPSQVSGGYISSNGSRPSALFSETIVYLYNAFHCLYWWAVTRFAFNIPLGRTLIHTLCRTKLQLIVEYTCTV